MSEIISMKRRIAEATFLAAGSALLLGACGSSGVNIESNKPSVILDKSKDTDWVSGEGWDHHRTTFTFILKQCDRSEQPADDEGCATISVNVLAPTYAEFNEGDTIIFKNERQGNLVS